MIYENEFEHQKAMIKIAEANIETAHKQIEDAEDRIAAAYAKLKELRKIGRQERIWEALASVYGETDKVRDLAAVLDRKWDDIEMASKTEFNGTPIRRTLADHICVVFPHNYNALKAADRILESVERN